MLTSDLGLHGQSCVTSLAALQLPGRHFGCQRISVGWGHFQVTQHLRHSLSLTLCFACLLPCVCPGGRQLDYSPSALDMLPGVVAAVGGRVPVWMDGGIRRGTDVLKVSYAAHRGVTAGEPVGARCMRCEMWGAQGC